MTENYRITAEVREGVGIFHVVGYLGEEVGQALLAKTEELLCEGVCRLVLSLEACSVISSPGVSFLLEIAGRVAELQGEVGLAGLDETKGKVLRFMGVMENAQEFSTVEDAVQALRDQKTA